jgi:hypothetical protein
MPTPNQGAYVQPDPNNSAQSFRVTAGGAAPGQTVKQFTAKIALNAASATTASLYTVTTGKTFLLTDLYIGHDTAAVIDVQVQAAGVTIFRACVKGDTAPLEFAGMDTGPLATTGQALTILWPATAGPPNAYYFLAGVEA